MITACVLVSPLRDQHFIHHTNDHRMKKFLLITPFVVIFLMVWSSCKKHVQELIDPKKEIPAEIVEKIRMHGYNHYDVQKTDRGYLVEGDMLLTEEDLNAKPEALRLRFGKEEQYHFGRLVAPLPKNIRVYVYPSVPASLIFAIDSAIGRYNALGLQISFTRVAAPGAEIYVAPSSPCPGGSEVSMPVTGMPFSMIHLPVCTMSSMTLPAKITLVAHMIGHCIGFRHTDWMGISYSCGSGGNEGSPAVHIPGTPTVPNPSWMLRCMSNNTNRPFTTYDIVALNYLY